MLRDKKIWLTMQQRVNVIKDLETHPISYVAEKYSVHPRTIKRIQERAVQIYNWAEKGKVEKRRKNFRQPKYADLEERLYVWFTERKCLGEAVSEALLLQKARELKEEFGASSNFKLSHGWLKNFKRRRHIRLVRMRGKHAEEADEENATEEGDEEHATEEGDEERASEEGDAERAAEKGDEERSVQVGGEERTEEKGDEGRAAEKGDEERAAEKGGEERAAEKGGEERAAQVGDEEKAAQVGDEEKAAQVGDEQRAAEEGDEVNWIELPSKIRKNFHVLFKQFRPLKKYLPPPARHQLEALKLTVLGYTTSKKRKLP